MKLCPVLQQDKLLVNLTRGTIACDHLVVADRAGRRMRGLLGRTSLSAGEGMLLAPAPSIHTAFMRFAIDAVFLDGTLQVKRIVSGLKPWRMSSARHAWAVLEIGAGEAAMRKIGVGDQLGVVEVDDNVTAVVTALRAGNRAALSDLATADPAANPAAGPVSTAAADEVTRVLIVGTDRRFRSVAATLLNRRGCEVLSSDRVEDIAELAASERVAVAVLDTGHSSIDSAGLSRKMAACEPAVGLVIVAERVESDAPVPMLHKWDSFELIYAAVEHARRERASQPTRA